VTTANNPRKELLAENESLRLRLEEAEDALRAIGSGEVDAIVVSVPDGEQVFTLKGAEHAYRVLVETMNEGAATLAADGSILYCNKRLAVMLQVPLEMLLGTQLGTYVSPADHPLFTARLGLCAEGCDKDEIIMITGEGNSVPVIISYCALDLSDGQGKSVVVTDITEQKRNEDNMAAEKLARSIIEQAGEAIIVCNEEGRVIRASRLAHELCGVNPLLKPFDELFQLRRTAACSLFTILIPLGGECFESIEVEFKRNDGQIFNLLLNARPLLSIQDRIIGCVVTLTDISERKKLDSEIKDAREYAENIVETVRKPLLVLNSDLKILTANQSFYATFEVTPEVTIGNFIYDLGNRQWDIPKLRVLFEEILPDDTVFNGYEVEHDFLNIGRKTILLNARQIFRKNIGSHIILLAMEDITERKQAEEEIKRLNVSLAARAADLENANMELEAFNYTVAHDLRNPLNVISSCCQVIRELCGDRLDEQCSGYLRDAYDGTLRMNRLIEALLNFSRLGQVEPHREMVDLSALAQEVVMLLRMSEPGRQVDFRTTGGIVVSGDASLLRVVLENLLGNAWKFTGRREGAVIEFCVAESAGKSVYCVRDNGTGFNMADVNRLFVPFQRLPGSEECRGSGIGLATAERIIRRHGGRVWAEGEPGKGATFYFTLSIDSPADQIKEDRQ